MASRLSIRAVSVAISSTCDLFLTQFQLSSRLFWNHGITAPAFIGVTPSVVAQFNKDIQVNSKVKYFTWAGDCTISGRPYLRKSTQNHPPLAFSSFRVQRRSAIYHPPQSLRLMFPARSGTRTTVHNWGTGPVSTHFRCPAISG